MSFHLFAGSEYYPDGGWLDHIANFRTIGAVRSAVDSTRRERVVAAQE